MDYSKFSDSYFQQTTNTISIDKTNKKNQQNGFPAANGT